MTLSDHERECWGREAEIKAVFRDLKRSGLAREFYTQDWVEVEVSTDPEDAPEDCR